MTPVPRPQARGYTRAARQRTFPLSCETLITFVLCFTLAACGGGGGGSGGGGSTGGTTSYAVSAVAGSGGSISPSSRTVNKGATTSFTVTAGTGYLIDKVTGCGGSLSGGTYTTGAITASCTVTASFKAATATTHTVTGTAGNGGTISPSTVTVNQGTTTNFTITPNSGYRIGGATGCNGSLSGGTYTTGTITGDCTVTASFIAVHTVTVTAGLGGTATPAGSVVVDDGANTTITATPDTGYGIADVSGCGTGTRSGNTYTTAPVTADCTVTATFTTLWTWVGGDNAIKARGTYGTPGTPSTSNIPGAREAPAVWTDTSGDLWLFGGKGYDATGAFSYLSDLWRYDPSTKQWTFMKGSNTIDAVGRYGTLGTAGLNNTPGARYRAVAWTDGSGKLWLFGGQGHDSSTSDTSLNDLWVYNPGTNKWTWMAGSSTGGANGTYGTLGVAATANIPGARSRAVAWTDGTGNFWLFGGYGYGYDPASTKQGYLNDLWRYDPLSHAWTWIAGSDTIDAVGTYGVKGVPGSNNTPGARSRPAAWIDANDNLWLFGGKASSYFNDLWKFDGTAWAWMGGLDYTNYAGGDYGTQGVAAATNNPGARHAAAFWGDGNGHFWLFGGMGDGFQGGQTATGQLNDLWEYDLASNQWIWVGGSNDVNASGAYGTQGTADAANIPGARDSAAAWRDSTGQFWLFGGHGYDSAGGTLDDLNDLWEFQP